MLFHCSTRECNVLISQILIHTTERLLNVSESIVLLEQHLHLHTCVQGNPNNAPTGNRLLSIKCYVGFKAGNFHLM